MCAKLLALLASTFLVFSAQALAQVSLIGEANTARTGGDYATLATTEVGACARLCAGDSLCMAWTYQAGACELKAVVPAPVSAPGATSGLSARAPEFARRLAPPAAEAPRAAALQQPPSPPGVLPSQTLLGGPDADLRPRLGGAT